MDGGEGRVAIGWGRGGVAESPMKGFDVFIVKFSCWMTWVVGRTCVYNIYVGAK